MTVLSIPAFGAGVVKEGSADSQRTDELSACDAFDIGPRGHLIVASDLSPIGRATNLTDTAALSPVFGMLTVAAAKNPILFFVGSDGTQLVLAGLRLADGVRFPTPFPGAPVAPSAGVIVTFAVFPYVKVTTRYLAILVSVAARAPQDPNSGYGLFVLLYKPDDGSFTFNFSDQYDFLGTGQLGEFPGGTSARILAPRGVIAYNNHAFAWGFDSKDSRGDGPVRLMFSNIGNPLKWGLDPDAQGIADGTVVESDRLFEDSDAFELGGAGEAIRGACVWRGRLYIGTNRSLHFVEGYGRESFKTNGALAIARSRNVIGANAMIEGPDDLLYGVSDRGLWNFAGAEVDPIGDKLRDFDDQSIDWWDLIWSNPDSDEFAVPGRTNQDLVWMASLPTLNQVWIVIPFCSASLGYGQGGDSVAIKYHTKTGGFTRQVFPNRILLAGSMLSREAIANAQTFVVDSAVSDQNVFRYGSRATPADSPMRPVTVPAVTFGPYAPFGADGVGVLGRKYLTLAWQIATPTIVFTLTLSVDDRPTPPVRVTIGAAQPGAPGNGDLWIDTSGANMDLGNGTAGAIIPASAADFLQWVYVSDWSRWVQLPGGGQRGRRITVPIDFVATRGSRFTVTFAQVSANTRYQLEQFGDKPVLIREAT